MCIANIICDLSLSGYKDSSVVLVGIIGNRRVHSQKSCKMMKIPFNVSFMKTFVRSDLW